MSQKDLSFLLFLFSKAGSDDEGGVMHMLLQGEEGLRPDDPQRLKQQQFICRETLIGLGASSSSD